MITQEKKNDNLLIAIIALAMHNEIDDFMYDLSEDDIISQYEHLKKENDDRFVRGIVETYKEQLQPCTFLKHRKVATWSDYNCKMECTTRLGDINIWKVTTRAGATFTEVQLPDVSYVHVNNKDRAYENGYCIIIDAPNNKPELQQLLEDCTGEEIYVALKKCCDEKLLNEIRTTLIMLDDVDILKQRTENYQL